MAAEIERKFLVAGDSWRALVRDRSRFRQAYLANRGTTSVRVRIFDDAAARLTIKSGKSEMVRDEFEYPIPLEDAEEMLALRLGAVIEKTRYRVPLEGHVWEVDVFSGENEGLVLAEIELSAPDEMFAKPLWLGEEVTGDPRYYNSELAVRPFKNWRDGTVPGDQDAGRETG
ncbi:MAG: adenylate cyclase [Rhodospirillaceae bacterium]|nr:adenylate cyclase [Rhodospirillaceae bacterium]